MNPLGNGGVCKSEMIVILNYFNNSHIYMHCVKLYLLKSS